MKYKTHYVIAGIVICIVCLLVMLGLHQHWVTTVGNRVLSFTGNNHLSTYGWIGIQAFLLCVWGLIWFWYTITSPLAFSFWSMYLQDALNERFHKVIQFVFVGLSISGIFLVYSIVMVQLGNYLLSIMDLESVSLLGWTGVQVMLFGLWSTMIFIFNLLRMP